jgi:hypothetical protein
MGQRDRAAPLAACAILAAYGVVALSEGAFARLGREDDLPASGLDGAHQQTIQKGEEIMRSGTLSMAVTTAGTCALCGLLTVAQSGDQAKGGRPNLSGRWELVPEKSDDAKGAIDTLLAPLEREGEEGRPPMEGGPPPGDGPGGSGGGMGGGRGGPGGGGMGGGRGGPGGGGMGGGGWGGGMGGGRGGWRGPDGDFQPPTEEERAAIRDAVETALASPASMAIMQTGAEIALNYPDGRVRHFYTDGRKFAANRVSRKAKWKDNTLVVETEAGKIKIKETFEAGPEAGQLMVQVQAKHPRFDGEVALTRVYKKAAD